MRCADIRLLSASASIALCLAQGAARAQDNALPILGASLTAAPSAEPVAPAADAAPVVALSTRGDAPFIGSSFDLAELGRQPAPQAPVQGPVDPQPSPQNAPDARYKSLGSRIGAAKWEAISLFAYITATQAYWTGATTSFHFKDEGWFGRDTKNLGIDKLTHAFNAYLFAEFLGARIARKTGDRPAAALPAAMLSMGLMLYGEMWDGHKEDSGFSVQDVIFNTGGAAFSVLRHTVPGLEEKLDFRLLLMPNSDIYTFKGKRHYEQQRFLLSLELAGFEGLKTSPLRFAELQVGYRGKNFTNAERARGVIPKRDIFFGIGLNVKQLFFRNSRSRLGRAISSGLNYFQLPYTAVHM